MNRKVTLNRHGFMPIVVAVGAVALVAAIFLFAPSQTEAIPREDPSIPTYEGPDSCPAGHTMSHVITTSVSGTDADGETINLNAGHGYVFKASGTFQANSNLTADAAYTWDGDGLRPEFGAYGTGDGYGAHALLGNLGNGVGIIKWGSPMNAQNIYSVYYQPAIDDVQLVIGDHYGEWFGTPWDNQEGMGDNSGSLSVEVYECVPEPATIRAHKIVCENESDLPNSGVNGWLAPITASTANDYVAAHPSCEIVDWQFQMRPHNTNPYNPGDNTGVASGAWSDPFSSTIDVPTDLSKVWVREVWNDAYIPFTYNVAGNNSDNVSAELYCNTDVLNYDNLEWIDNIQPGQEYYCVGFNVKVKKISPILECVLDNGEENYTAFFGYENKNGFDVNLPISNQNKFTGGGTSNWDQGQPTTFTTPNVIPGRPGRTDWYPNAEFSVDFNGTNLVWSLNGKTATASDNPAQRCEPVCGNGIVEEGEQCDGDEGCSQECTWLAGSIQGRKYYDVNMNGDFDKAEKNEPGDPNRLDDWAIYLFDTDWNPMTDGPLYTGHTGLKGQYRFGYVLPGEYYVCEENRSELGWHQTEPASGVMYNGLYCHTVTVEPDEDVVGVQFGNYQAFDLHGIKWDDRNMNGLYDCVQEPGYGKVTGAGDLGVEFRPMCEEKLSGWTIFLDENDNQMLDNEERSTTTSSEDNEHYGWYWFEGLPAGTYHICEVQQEGWTQTYPVDPVCHEVTLPLNQVAAATVQITDNFVEQAPEFNFGNYMAMCGNMILDEGEECDGPTEGLEPGQYCHRETCTIEQWYTLEKTDNKETAEPGEESTYEVTFGYTTEEHPIIMGGTIIDYVPAEFTVDEASISDSGVYDEATHTITWNLDAVAGSAHTFTFSGTIDEEMPDGTTLLTNTAELYQNPMAMAASFEQEIVELQEPEPVLLLTAMDETSVTVTPEIPETVSAAAELTIEKTVSDDIVNPSQTVTYTVVVKNTSSEDAMNVVMTDTLPAGLTFANEDGSNSGETEKTWTWDTLKAGASNTITYDVLVDSQAGADIYDNIAVVYADDVDEVSAKASTEVKIPAVLGEETAMLEVEKTVAELFVNPGGTATYTITVTNVSDTVANNVRMTDTLPVGLTFKHPGGSVFTWELGDLVPDETVTKTYPVLVAADAIKGDYVNTVIVSSDDTENVSAQATLEVREPAVLGAEEEIPEELPVTGAGALAILGLASVAAGTGLIAIRRKK